MIKTRKRFSPEMKASAAEYGIHPTQVAQWKKQVLEQAMTLFAHPASTAGEEALTAWLYQEIGQLKVELDWLIKSGAGALRRNGC